LFAQPLPRNGQWLVSHVTVFSSPRPPKTYLHNVPQRTYLQSAFEKVFHREFVYIFLVCRCNDFLIFTYSARGLSLSNRSAWTYVTRYCGHFWPIVQPQMIDEDDCGAIGGMKIGRGNRSTRRKLAPAPFCPPQIPLDQTRARTRAAAVGSQRLTAWAMARPLHVTVNEAQMSVAGFCGCGDDFVSSMRMVNI
jgi:hypothetical protein